MLIFILSYIVPILVMASVAPLLGHYLAGWFGWLIFSIGLGWEIISIIRSIQSVKGGWQGVIEHGGVSLLRNPGTHWIWLGIWCLKKFRTGEYAHVLEVSLSRKVASLETSGSFKKVAAYCTIVNPVLASQCEDWRTEIKVIVADAVGDWIQNGSYRNNLLGRNADDLENFSQNAADMAAMLGIRCKVSLYVEPS